MIGCDPKLIRKARQFLPGLHWVWLRLVLEDEDVPAYRYHNKSAVIARAEVNGRCVDVILRTAIYEAPIDRRLTDFEYKPQLFHSLGVFDTQTKAQVLKSDVIGFNKIRQGLRQLLGLVEYQVQKYMPESTITQDLLRWANMRQSDIIYLHLDNQPVKLLYGPDEDKKEALTIDPPFTRPRAHARRRKPS